MLQKGLRQQKLSKKEFPFDFIFLVNNRIEHEWLGLVFIDFNLVYIPYRLLDNALLSAIHDQYKWHDLSYLWGMR